MKRLCPACGYVIDAAAAATAPRPPRAGDIGICLSCAAILILDDDGLPDRLASPTDLDRLRTEALEQAREAVDFIRSRGPLPPKGART